jgi:hypothetical protein
MAIFFLYLDLSARTATLSFGSQHDRGVDRFQHKEDATTLASLFRGHICCLRSLDLMELDRRI